MVTLPQVRGAAANNGGKPARHMIETSRKTTMELTFPWGVAVPAVDWTGAIIPELVSGVTVAETLGVPGTIDRRDRPQVQDELLMPDLSHGGFRGKAADWMSSPFYIPGVSEAGVRYMERNSIITDNEDDPMDLGLPHWSDIYDWADENIFDGGLPGGTLPPVNPIYYGPGNGGGGTPNVPALPAPGNGGGGGGRPPAVSCTTQCGPYPVMKRVCGEYRWVLPKKKRRKQLFTQRDAAQLSSLLNIAGNGQLAKAWIATHS